MRPASPAPSPRRGSPSQTQRPTTTSPMRTSASPPRTSWPTSTAVRSRRAGSGRLPDVSLTGRPSRRQPARARADSAPRGRRRLTGGGGGFRLRVAAGHVHHGGKHPGDRPRRAACDVRRLPARRGDVHRADLPRPLREPRSQPRRTGGRVGRTGWRRPGARRFPPHSISKPRAQRSRDTSARRTASVRTRLVALLLVLVAAVAARCDARPPASSQRAADHLRSRLADRRVSDVRRGPELQLRGLERARDADPERRPGRRLRVGCAPEHATPLPCRPRREAGHLHRQPPRVDRAKSKSGRNQDDLRPALEAREARRRGACGAGRRLHDHRPAQDGALERPRQGRQPRVGCARR